jgi:hypothetical protein
MAAVGAAVAGSLGAMLADTIMDEGSNTLIDKVSDVFQEGPNYGQGFFDDPNINTVPGSNLISNQIDKMQDRREDRRERKRHRRNDDPIPDMPPSSEFEASFGNVFTPFDNLPEQTKAVNPFAQGFSGPVMKNAGNIWGAKNKHWGPASSKKAPRKKTPAKKKPSKKKTLASCKKACKPKKKSEWICFKPKPICKAPTKKKSCCAPCASTKKKC